MDNFEQSKQTAKIRVVGVGGAGCNAINTMIAANLDRVHFVAANTDIQALAAPVLAHRLLPTADVGFVGLARDEESLVATTYANRLPADLSGRAVFVLDPMLATGGTLETVFGMLIERGAGAVTGVSLLAAPEGIARLESAFPGAGSVPVRVVTAALDERLNDRGFIVPGLGDAGDRLFGEI